MLLVAHWFRAFAWTLAIEIFAAGWVLRGAAPWLRRSSLVVVCNLASHPAVWLIFPEIGAALGCPGWLVLLVSEAWALGLEAWIYGLFLGTARRKTALVASLVANGASFTLGLGLHALGWA